MDAPQLRHICSHPALQDLRLLHRRDIDHLLLCLQHTVLPASHRWVSLLVRYVEDHMWEDSERARDLWIGGWTRHTLDDVLLKHSDSQIPLDEYTRALNWLTQLTLLLKRAQTALHSVRRQILRHTTIIQPSHVTLRRPRRKAQGPRTQTLFSAWYIRYSRQRTPNRSPRYTEVTSLHKSHHSVRL